MKVAIVSLGRLGQRFYQYSHQNGLNPIGTFYNSPKDGLKGIQYDFASEKIPDQIQDSDVLLFNLTPSAISEANLFQKFVNDIETKKFVFISSTSVYGNQGEVDEDTLPKPETYNGDLLLKCEDILLKSSLNSTIIRPAGLYCDQSHPAHYLAGKEKYICPKQPVNLVHLDDLVHIIGKSVNSGEKIINAVNSNHPAKGDYYHQYCMRNELAAPKFLGKEENGHKIVTTKFEEYKVTTKLP